MKTLHRSTLVVTALAFAALIAGVAQAPPTPPPGAPAGTTGLCNDGSYWTGASKSGACRGHKGVKAWYAASAAAPTSAATRSAPAAAARKRLAVAAHLKTSVCTAPTTPAPGGGPGMVWVNTSTKVYHCYGTKYYGTTKAGAYMSEADAKAKGAHPDAGKPCS